MKTNNNLPTDPSSVKTRFAVRFVQAMKKLNKKRPPKASMANRYLAIRAAAYVSMACAVGPRRAWSRAVLKNIRNLMPRRNNRVTRKRLGNNNNNPKRGLGFGEEEDDLRRLVPGGEGMGYCRLLSESAHYIQCLRDQVQVMTTMLHHYSTTY